MVTCVLWTLLSSPFAFLSPSLSPAPPPMPPPMQPILVGFQQSAVYDPYIVVSPPASSPDLDLQAAVEAAVVGGAGGGTGGALAGSGAAVCGVLSLKPDGRGGGGGGGAGGEWRRLGEWSAVFVLCQRVVVVVTDWRGRKARSNFFFFCVPKMMLGMCARAQGKASARRVIGTYKVRKNRVTTLSRNASLRSNIYVLRACHVGIAMLKPSPPPPTENALWLSTGSPTQPSSP